MLDVEFTNREKLKVRLTGGGTLHDSSGDEMLPRISPVTAHPNPATPIRYAKNTYLNGRYTADR